MSGNSDGRNTLVDEKVRPRSHAIGPALIWGTVGLSLILWVLASPVSSRIASEAATLKSLANIGAFVGTVLYSWSLVLSARWLWTDRLFHGLDKVYKWHHITGGLSFLFLTIHPLFLTARALRTAPQQAITLWTITSNWQINFGSIALYAMALLLLVTVFARLRHQAFVWIHSVLGAVFFFGFLHAVLAHGNMSRYWPLNLYMVAVMLMAVYAFLYHSVFGLFLPSRYRYEVESVKQHGRDNVEIILTPKGRLMNFVPGQFAFVSFHGAPINPEAHPYSMASGFREKNLRFVVKALGDYSASLLALRPKTPALLEGPHGDFSYKNTANRHQVWIAGGIGVTPFLSMARSLGPGYTIDFYYCVPTKADAFFEPELMQLSQSYPTFHLHTFCQDTQGFIDPACIHKECGIADQDFFLCGPPPMMKAMRAGLLKAGVPDKQIYFEDFSFK